MACWRIMSLTFDALDSTLCNWVSTVMGGFMPRYEWSRFLVWCIEAFLVELGAAINVGFAHGPFMGRSRTASPWSWGGSQRLVQAR